VEGDRPHNPKEKNSHSFTNHITYWGNGREAAIRYDKTFSPGHPEEEDIDISLLQHISPVEWENVVLYGEYVIDPKLIR
jgi:hypothetical protein